MKQLILGVVAAMAMGSMAGADNTVTVTKFHQSYPYAGKATVEYTVGGTPPANAVAEITLSADGASATFTQNSVVAGETVTATKAVDASGSTEFTKSSEAPRFYRLSAEETE